MNITIFNVRLSDYFFIDNFSIEISIGIANIKLIIYIYQLLLKISSTSKYILIKKLKLWNFQSSILVFSFWMLTNFLSFYQVNKTQKFD